MIGGAKLFDHLPLPIVFIGATPGTAHANERARSLLELAPGQAKGRAVCDALARVLGEAAGSPAWFKAAAAQGLPLAIEADIGGHGYRAEARPITEGDEAGLVWMFHEINRDDIDVPLLVNPSRFIKVVLDRLDEGLMVLDGQHRIRVWNDTYVRMLDLPRTLVTQGADVTPLIHILAQRGDYGPGDPETIAAQISENLRLRRTARGERQMANGRIIDAEWIALEDGYFLFRLNDVTTERTASRFKDELIATVSHELRTPLTVVGGALTLLRAGGVQRSDADKAELLDVAHKNAERLARLVNDLLDIDKLQSGTLDFQFEPTDLGLLLDAAVQQNQPYSQELGVVIDLELPDQPVTAEVDRGRMLQVMSNLLSNAAKFSAPGSRARVRLTAGAASARISVIDRGRGMSPEFRRRLFTRFAQEDRIATPGKAGTGLGLAICKSIVDRHGGQMHVETKVAVGTIFHIDLPYHQPAGPAAEEAGLQSR